MANQQCARVVGKVPPSRAQVFHAQKCLVEALQGVKDALLKITALLAII